MGIKAIGAYIVDDMLKISSILRKKGCEKNKSISFTCLFLNVNLVNLL